MTDKLALVSTRLDPQALIAAAIDKGASIETLERLVNLAKDVRQVTAREAWFDAMATFQQKCPSILKSKTANIVSARGSYKYSYAPLDEILGVVQPLLGELGLSVSWRQKHEPQAVHASCVVAHKLGHQEESGFIAMPYANDGRMNPAQAVGSALTYARRYSLLAILGLAPEDDDDAQCTDVRGGDAQSRRDKVAASASTHRASTESDDASDPETHRAESEALIRDPQIDVERERLLNEVKGQARRLKLTEPEKRDLWEIHVGRDVTPSQADPAALNDLFTTLQARKPK